MNFFYNASAEQRALNIPMSLPARGTKHNSSTTKTLIRGVKLNAVFILTTCLQVSAKTNAQVLTISHVLIISIKNGSQEKAFTEIGKKTGYVFFYDAAISNST